VRVAVEARSTVFIASPYMKCASLIKGPQLVVVAMYLHHVVWTMRRRFIVDDALGRDVDFQEFSEVSSNPDSRALLFGIWSWLESHRGCLHALAMGQTHNELPIK
jgi:hypothetical protein